MKPNHVLSLLALLLSCSLSAQTYHYQYTHDTLGNRVSRVYQGTVPSKENVVEQDTSSFQKEDVTIDDIEGTEEPLSYQNAEKDTTKHGPLVKTQAEKEAYLDSVMAAVLAQTPFNDDGDTRVRSGYSVGAIPLLYGVCSSGGRTYSVPISTAPDIKYAPALSLVYNSQGGYGYGGYGWDLGGLSSITLTSESPYWDDNIAAASTEEYDCVFCLDGIRLVRNTHRATRDAYPLVTATGPRILVAPVRGQSGYVTSFTVLYPDGSRATFGSGTDLGFTLPSYPMTSSTSLEGNRIEYCYSLDSTDGNHAIDSVRYGIDAAGGAAAVIRFTPTANTQYSYYAGKKVKRAPRITGISSFSSGTALYTYSLSYISADGTYLLKSISLANSSGEQLPPLSFTYGTEASPHYSPDSLKVIHTGNLQYVVSPGTAGFALRRGKFTKGNYNDGLIAWRDLPVYYEIEQDHYACGFDPSTLPPQCYAFAASIADETQVIPMPHGDGFQCLEAVDTDGDGVDELVRVCCGALSFNPMGSTLLVNKYILNSFGNPTDSASFSVLLNGYLDTGDFMCPYRRTYRWGDFLGNGKTQLAVITCNDNGFGYSQSPSVALIDLDEGEKLFDIQSSYHLSIASSDDRLLQAMDIDGDGRTELCQATNDGLRVYRLSQNGYLLEKTLSSVPLAAIDSDRTYYADINADGYIDILQAPSSGSSWTLYTNTGLDFTQSSITICSVSSSEGYLFMDIDRDGYPDLMRVSGTDGIGFYPNQDGMSFGSYKSGYLYLQSLGSILPPNVVDYTAMSSFVTVDGNYIREFGYTSYAHPKRHLVQSRDSYGKVVRNTYGYLPNSCLYWTESPTGIDNTNGYQLRALPLYVLTGAKGFMSASDTSQVILNDTYSWWDGVVHTKGLGFCGFSKTRTASVLDDITNVSVSRFNPQKKGVPVSSAQYLGSENTTPYRSVAYTFDSHSTTYGKLDPWLTQTVETDALTGVISTQYLFYDTYGFPVTSSIRKTSSVSGNTVSSLDVTYTSYVHHNVVAKYIMGVIANQTILHNCDGDGDLGAGKYIVYNRDTLYRPLIQHTYTRRLENYSYHNYLVSTDRWQYDSHGNVIREESAPSGSNVFVGTSYTYDATGRHLTSSTDALGHTTTYSDFDAFGNPGVATDHKGHNTLTYRDGWGVPYRIIRPDGTYDTFSLSWGGTGAYTRTTTSSGAPDVAVDYDAAGREVLSSNRRFDGQWQKVRSYYNQRGLVTRHSQPYRGSNEPSIYGWQWIYHYYDSYGRPTKVQEASGRKTLWTYNGTSVTERKDGVKTTRTMNPAGALLSVADSLGTITYTYRDDGQPTAITTSTGAVTTFAYDTLGRRTSIVDPSAGARNTSYVTNTNGSSSVTETNALGSITTSYDSLGRVTTIVRPDFNTTFAYDTNGCLLSKVSTNGTSSRYTYDQYDRMLTVKDSVPDGKWLQKAYTYSPDGLVYYIAYTSQSGYITTETYGYSYGHNVSVSLPDGTYVYQLTAENNFGQPTSATSGSVTRSYSYSNYGKPTYRKLNNGGLQDLRTWFDETTGNLSGRMRISGNSYLSESFTYDHLNRLTGIGTRGIAYDANNNISSIGGSGSMDYSNGIHPYAITDFNATAAAGTDQQSIMYKAYGRPWYLLQGNAEATLTYNADYGRVRMEYYDAAGNPGMNYYIGDRYEIRNDPGSSTSTQLLYLGGDAYSAPMVLRKQGSGSWTPYVIGRDYLGSITHIATVDGTLVEERSYDAWGRLRDPATNAVYAADSQPSLFLGRGFCGHEHLPLFGLINMNARLYDPLVGRFLSPDPYIQAPDIPGNFNRYSYCLNNPLKYTDEDGEFWNIIIGAAIGGIGNIISNWSTIKQKGFWSGVGFFAVGAGVGALSAVGAGWLAGVTHAAGVWAGALIGSATGAATGAASNALTTIGNNLIAQKNWYDGVKASALQGALWGGISGAVSGGIKGYQYAKEHGADPWSNRLEDNTFKADVKKGVSIQPDSQKECYELLWEIVQQAERMLCICC